jgi:hypothetical protein
VSTELLIIGASYLLPETVNGHNLDNLPLLLHFVVIFDPIVEVKLEILYGTLIVPCCQFLKEYLKSCLFSIVIFIFSEKTYWASDVQQPFLIFLQLVVCED